MSGYLHHLATRALQPAKSLRPELPSIFAPPRVADDSPFESDVSLQTGKPAPRSSVTNDGARSHAAPSIEASGDPEGIESEWETATDAGGRKAQRRAAQSDPGWEELARGTREIPSSDGAVSTEQIEHQARSAVSSRVTHAASESAASRNEESHAAKVTPASQDVAPAVPVSPSETKQRLETAARRDVPGQSGTGSRSEGEIDSSGGHFRSETLSGRLTEEPASSGFDHPFSADAKKLASQHGAGDRSTPAEDIAKLLVSRSGVGRTLGDLEVRDTGHLWPASSSSLSGTTSPLKASNDSIAARSVAALAKSRTAVSASEIPAQLRSLGQAGTQAPRSKARPEPAAEPAIQVTIGRIEVRAPSSQTTARSAQRTSSNGPTLEEYLRARSPRGRA